MPTDVFGPVDFFAFFRLASIFRSEDPFDGTVRVCFDSTILASLYLFGWMRLGQSLRTSCRRHTNVRWSVVHNRKPPRASCRSFRGRCLILQYSIQISTRRSFRSRYDCNGVVARLTLIVLCSASLLFSMELRASLCGEERYVTATTWPQSSFMRTKVPMLRRRSSLQRPQR